MQDKLLLEWAIQEQPVNTLEQCLQFADLGDLAERNNIDFTPLEDETAQTEQLIPLLLEKMPKSFERDIRFFGADGIAFINEAIRCMRENVPLGDDFPRGYHFLEHQGFIYLFAWEEQLWPVFPEELWPIWEKAMKDETLLFEIKHNQELMTYATALANLYGIYELEQLAVVWNQHHKEKITDEEAESFLKDTCYYQHYYWLDDDGWVVHDSVYDDDEFDNLREKAEDLPYFMPTKSLIALYADDGVYDENRPELQKMLAFLKTVVPEDVPRRDDLDFEVVYSCERNWTPIAVAQTLEEYDFPLDDAKATEEFSKLYQPLYENTHQWLLRGDTPANYAREHNARLNQFSLPSLKPRKVKKVGRNDPCPCGSGKKYKKCCGT